MQLYLKKNIYFHLILLHIPIIGEQLVIRRSKIILFK